MQSETTITTTAFGDCSSSNSSSNTPATPKCAFARPATTTTTKQLIDLVCVCLSLPSSPSLSLSLPLLCVCIMYVFLIDLWRVLLGLLGQLQVLPLLPCCLAALAARLFSDLWWQSHNYINYVLYWCLNTKYLPRIANFVAHSAHSVEGKSFVERLAKGAITWLARLGTPTISLSA